MIATPRSLVLGIDEAGRGPVIGDMFVACVGVEEGYEELLRNLGVKDSKTLTPSARSAMFPRIIEIARVVYVRRCSPALIDSINVNDLFVKAVLDSVKAILRKGFNVSKIYVDALSSRKHKAMVMKGIPSSVELVYEPRADSKYAVVAAASIVAKHLRDVHVKNLHLIYGDFGSGYPSDSRTMKWLADHVLLETPIVRRSWSTLSKVGVKPVKKTQGLLKWVRSSDA
ncbi:MAG: ribonuclease HII [Zestosphaera sp.]